MDAPISSLAESGPLAATLLADAVLEQTWLATEPETWFAAPLIVAVTCAVALAKSTLSDSRAQTVVLPDVFDRFKALIASYAPLNTVIGAALRELRALAGARGVLVAVESPSSPALLFTETSGGGDKTTATVRTLAAHERSTYFFCSPTIAEAMHGPVAFATPMTLVPSRFANAHPFQHLSGLAFDTGEWQGRVFLLDGVVDAHRGALLDATARLLRQLLPALARVCDLHARRHHAEARERARLGRELHDGVVQELSCLDMELELVGNAGPNGGIRDRIGRIQERLRAQLRNLRTMIHDARCHDIDASRLPAVIESIVQRFARETGVDARFVAEISEVRLTPPVCGEIARIVQEALVNVRRHSGARHVVVTFWCDNADWRLWIQDDGRGFGRPRHAHGAGPRAASPPAVIHERVHSLGGTVRVVALGPSGARLEISARQRDPWTRMA